MYPVCLDIGITPSMFWDHSIGELEDLISSYNRTKTLRDKEKATYYWVLSKQIGEQISILFDNKNEITPKKIWEYYPTLFENEKSQFEKDEKKAQLELHIARMKDYMYRHNSRLGGGI